VSLAKAGVPVHLCRDIAESMGKAQEFTALGFTLEYARDAFVRYPVEGRRWSVFSSIGRRNSRIREISPRFTEPGIRRHLR
jgi:hypothetical protein